MSTYNKQYKELPKEELRQGKLAMISAFWILSLCTSLLLGYILLEKQAPKLSQNKKVDEPSQINITEPDDNYTILLQHGSVDTRIGEANTPKDLSIEAYSAGELGYYIIQFDNLILPEWATQLESEGVEILGYIPNNAYLIRTILNITTLEALDHVQWIGIYQPAYRVAPELIESQTDTETLIVTIITFPGVSLDQLVAQLKSWGGQVLAISETELGGNIRVKIESKHISNIAHYGGVKWIEPWVEPRLSNN